MESIFDITPEEFLPTEERFRVSMDEVLGNVHNGWYETSTRLRSLLGVRYDIDEMALWFPSAELAMMWITLVVQRDGYELFNSVSDEVTTSPIPSKYGVTYWFLRTPNNYRLEVMCLRGGYSPYHTALQHTTMLVAAVHASFKVPDEESYANAIRTFTSEGYGVYQHCTSSYGKFSYLRDMESVPDKNNWLIKPRINIRDGAE